MIGLWERTADLPLVIEDLRLEPLRRAVSSDFERHTTVVVLTGRGQEGRGEDVTYDAADQARFQERGTELSPGGSTTFGAWSQRLAAVDLFPGKRPSSEAYRRYRRWAFESAALDLALRQAGTTLGDHWGLEVRPVRFVVSLRLGDPPDARRVHRWLALDPTLRFKLDPTSGWSSDLVRDLAATGAIESVDLKGAYRGTVVDQPPDPALYDLVARGFPEAWIEDPAETPECREVLAPHRDRVTWDAPIHSADDVRSLAHRPRALNVKPSRIGSVRELLELYEHCASHEIRPYGGGQFELGPGRGQIQLLAAMFHPVAPNDVAPGGYNDPEPRPGLPRNPMRLRVEPGFRAEAVAP